MVEATSGVASVAIPVSNPAPSPAPAAKTNAAALTEGRDRFAAGTGRTVSFSFIFLLLLPFFVSLGPMLFWRVSQGQWTGTVGLIILAVAFTAVMYLIFVELIFSVRSYVKFGETTVRLSLPQDRGFRAPFSYVLRDIPYEDIAAVEIRREVYGGSLAPVMMKGARIRLRDGSHYKIGYVNEANVDPCLPFSEIAEKIAARAGVEIIDQGDVRRSAVKKFLRMAASGNEVTPIAPEEVAALNARHNMLMSVLVGTMVFLVGLGIALDRDTSVRGANLLATLWSSSTPTAAADNAKAADPKAKTPAKANTK